MRDFTVSSFFGKNMQNEWPFRSKSSFQPAFTAFTELLARFYHHAWHCRVVWTPWTYSSPISKLYRQNLGFHLVNLMRYTKVLGVLISGFCSMKWLGVFLISPGWDASPLQGQWPPVWIRWYPFIHLGEERHCDSKVSCPRTQCSDPTMSNKSVEKLRSKIWFLSILETFPLFPPKQCWFFYV